MTNPRDDTEPPQLYAVPPPDDEFDRRTPPQDLAAEQSVLGGMMLSRTAITEVTPILDGHDFYRPAHKLIYDAIQELAGADEPVDAVTVSAHLQRRGQLSKVGGAPYLHTLISSVPTAANAGYYAGIVAERATLRRIVEAGTKVVQLGYAGRGGDVDDIAQAAQTEISKATQGRTAGHPSTWQPLPLAKYLYGAELDSLPPSALARTDGPCLLYAGAVHSIAGEPESGKSWVALIAAAQEITQAYDVLYVDFEDRPARVIGRLLELGAHPAQIEQHFRYVRPEVALSASTAPHLAAAAEGATLAVIDGITEAMTLHGLSLLDNEDVARWLTLLPRRLADLGPAVLQIDHVVKNSEARGRFAIGGQHKLAGIDGCAYKIAVTEPFGRGKRGHARITLDKDREGHVRALAMGLTVATLTIDSRATERHDAATVRAYLDPPTSDVGPDGGLRPTGLMEKVSRYLELNPGATGGEVEKVVRGKAQYVRDALRVLVNEGYLRAEPGARGAVRHYSEQRFREDEE